MGNGLVNYVIATERNLDMQNLLKKHKKSMFDITK